VQDSRAGDGRWEHIENVHDEEEEKETGRFQPPTDKKLKAG
jgi:hypothetical protein